MKIPHLLIVSVTIVSCILVTSQAYAIPYMSPQDLYKQSDMVFYGKVISKQAGPGPDYDYYQVTVNTYFKNPQTSESITVAGHKQDNATHMSYPQFQVGDKAIFYINKLDGINTISPYSQIAGDGCDIHAFLGPGLVQGEPIIRDPGHPLMLTNENGLISGPFLTNHPVFPRYEILNNNPFSKNFTIEVSIEDQNDTSITFYKKQILELGACEYTGDALKWSVVPTKSGIYSVNVNVDGQFRLGDGFPVTDANPVNNQNLQVVLSPLEQFRSGINTADVTCKQGLQLVLKTEDASPACVTPQTGTKLIQIGWAMPTISLKPGMVTDTRNLGNDTGIITLENQTYYFETPNYTDEAYSNSPQLTFHDVLFTLFPHPFSGGLPVGMCGPDGKLSYYWTDTKFADSTHEILKILVGSEPCAANSIPTKLGSHTNPQAGLMFYDGKMKLLVNTGNQSVVK